MRRVVLPVVFILVLAVVLAGCFGRPSGGGSKAPVYGLSGKFLRPGEGASVVASTRFVVLPWETVVYAGAQASKSGYYTPETAPFHSRSQFQLWAWKQQNGSRQNVTANWVLADAGFGTIVPYGDSVLLVPNQVGETTVYAVVDGTTLEMEIVVYPGIMLDNGQPGYPSDEANRGHIGYNFALETYVTDPSMADIYIDASGTVRAPGGVVQTSYEGLHAAAPISDAQFIGAPTNIGSGGRATPDGSEFIELPSVPTGISILMTRDGRQVAIDTGSVYASSEGYRAYAFGYRILK